MAFSIKIAGEDSLPDGEKIAFERHLSEEVRALVHRLASKPNVSVVKWDLSVDTLDDESFKA